MLSVVRCRVELPIRSSFKTMSFSLLSSTPCFARSQSKLPCSSHLARAIAALSCGSSQFRLSLRVALTTYQVDLIEVQLELSISFSEVAMGSPIRRPFPTILELKCNCPVCHYIVRAFTERKDLFWVVRTAGYLSPHAVPELGDFWSNRLASNNFVRASQQAQQIPSRPLNSFTPMKIFASLVNMSIYRS